MDRKLKPLTECWDLPRDQMVNLARFDASSRQWVTGRAAWITRKEWAPWTHLVTDSRDTPYSFKEAMAKDNEDSAMLIGAILGFIIGVMTSAVLFWVLTWRSHG